MTPSRDVVFHALAHPVRRALLESLSDGEKQAGELAAPFDMSFAAVSQHLKILREACLVTERRDGKNRVYACNADPLFDVLTWVNRFKPFWDRKLDALSDYLDNAA